MEQILKYSTHLADSLQMHMRPVASQVLFNPAKHHLRYLQAMLLRSLIEGTSVFSTLIPGMGNNLMDLYLGTLSPLSLSSQIVLALGEQQRLEPTLYRGWIEKQKGHFYNMKLSDHSVWTLLQSKQEKYIHIHPARYSPHTLRVKALSLKTACWVGYTLLCKPGTELTLDMINQHRAAYLGASPIRSVNEAKKLVSTIQLLIHMEE